MWLMSQTLHLHLIWVKYSTPTWSKLSISTWTLQLQLNVDTGPKYIPHKSVPRCEHLYINVWGLHDARKNVVLDKLVLYYSELMLRRGFVLTCSTK